MTGLGIIVMFIGYAIIYWAINALQGSSQQPFVSYIFPYGA